MASNLKKPARILLTIGTTQYVVVTAVAMFFYPGGRFGDRNSVGYEFFSNYFSDLVRTIAWNSIPNPTASVLYYIANIIYGVSLLLFFLSLASEFPKGSYGKGTGPAATIWGIFAGLGTLIYAITPSDTMGLAHGIGAYIGYLSTFFAVLLLGIASKKHREHLRPEGIILISIAILFFTTLLLMGVGAAANILFLEMLMQKAGKYLIMLILAIEGILWFKRA